MNIFKSLESEKVEDYVLRLSEEKKTNKEITWQSIADALEIEFGIIRSEAWVRRLVKSSLNDLPEEDTLLAIEDANQKLQENILELKKEKVKISDERTQNRAYIRKLSRIETYRDIAIEAAQEVSKIKILPKYNLKDSTPIKDKEAILCIGDWHYGLEFKNPWNEFNPEICKERINKLRDKVIQYIKINKCNHLHLVNLGDLIAGRIHLGLRLESRYDVITQTMYVSEILAEFISNISKYIDITYYDCLDNHSRLEPNKNDAQDLETLCRMIPWYLKERLKDNKKVSFKENEFGYDIITFETMGYKCVCAHGDKDPIKNIDHLSMMTEQHYDLLLTAHMHHFQADEKNKTIALGNGSLMGTDSYAQKLRLSSNPSQNLIIVSKENVTECVYRIIL